MALVMVFVVPPLAAVAIIMMIRMPPMLLAGIGVFHKRRIAAAAIVALELMKILLGVLLLVLMILPIVFAVNSHHGMMMTFLFAHGNVGHE